VKVDDVKCFDQFFNLKAFVPGVENDDLKSASVSDK
jgi:hypothetical protein